MGLELTALLVMGAAWAVEGDTTPTFGTAAGSANPGDVGAIRRNPAAMLLEVAYTSQVDLALGQGPRLTVAVRDTRTSAFGAGVMVTHQWTNQAASDEDMPGWKEPGVGVLDKNREGSYRISAGYGFLPQAVVSPSGNQEIRRVAIGASVAYDRWTETLTGMRTGWALDLSVAGRPVPSLVVAGTARDLMTPLGLREPSYDLGVWWEPWPWIGFGADGGYDPNIGPLVTHGGAEVLISNVFVLRGGYGLEGSRQFVAGGAGLVAEDRVRVDYGIRYDLFGEDVGRIEHSVGIYASF